MLVVLCVALNTKKLCFSNQNLPSGNKPSGSSPIQDAKNGDVLITMSNKYPFLYKDCLDPNHPESPVAYCGIDDEGDFCIGRRAYWWTDEEVQPATKEQHDLLFQKMKEAGYEWNSGKKALKKIDNEEFNGED